MTENEALRYIRLFREEWDKNSKTKNAEALDVAIKSLEEIQSYRAIDTVEDIRETYSLCKILSNVVKDYSVIGTVEEFKALKKTDIPIIHGKAELDLHDREVRSKAIDEFAEKIIDIVNEFPTVGDDFGEIRPMTIEEMCNEIAEQLKGEKQ